MQLQWKQEPSPATAQLEEWGRKYVVYNGQYDVVFDSGSKEASEEDKITKLWSQTLPALLMAPSEEEFDTLFEDDLYMKIGASAIAAADQIRDTLTKCGYRLFLDSPQIRYSL